MAKNLNVKTIDAGVLAVSYLEDGPPDGWPALLWHGFPQEVVAGRPRVSTGPLG